MKGRNRDLFGEKYQVEVLWESLGVRRGRWSEKELKGA